MDTIRYAPIGVARSPFREMKNTPIQPSAARDTEGQVDVYPEFAEGLKDLEGFSHVILVFHCHLAGKYSLRVIPYMDDELRGVFATRAPSRPNPIGISVVRLLRIEGSRLAVKGLDIIDGTPILDIKPYVPEFVPPGPVEIGWLEKRVRGLPHTKADGRFQDR